MSDFQKKLAEQKRKQEELRQHAMSDFLIMVQKNFPESVGTSSGLHYVILQQGTGGKPLKNQSVSVHYKGMLADGTEFDSSYNRGAPITFPLGVRRVIAGWDEGISLLQVGSKAKLIIPYFLAYGDSGRPPIIPPRATLIFEVELVSVS